MDFIPDFLTKRPEMPIIHRVISIYSGKAVKCEMKYKEMEIVLREDEKLLYALRTLYRQYGYRSFRMSKFEKYEFYAGNKDFLVSDRVIAFTDTDGELLALKPDVTLSIVRGTAYRPEHKEKLCYQENVYRPSGGSGRFREIMQAGLECIGDLDSNDVAEVLLLAEKSLNAISEENTLCVSHLGIFRGLLSALDPESGEREELLKLISERNIHELEALFTRKSWNAEILYGIRDLLELDCSVKDLPHALLRLNRSFVSRAVLEELEAISSLSSGQARFDFSVINNAHYYNGIVFQGFVRRVPEKVLSGGQYGALLRRMGRAGEAIGFAVYFDTLEQLDEFRGGGTHA